MQHPRNAVRPAEDLPRTTHRKRSRKDGVPAQERTDARPGGDIHPPVLTEPAFLLDLSPITADELFPQTGREEIERAALLLDENRPLLGLKGGPARIVSLQDLGRAVAKVNDDTDIPFHLSVFLDESGHLSIRAREELLDYDLNYIPIKPTYEMSGDAGALTRGVISAFCRRFDIHPITDTSEYAYMTSYEQDEREYNHEETDEEMDFDFHYLDGYRKGEMLYEKLNRFLETEPATLRDIEAFKPATAKESLLKSLLLKGVRLSLLEPGTHRLKDYLRITGSDTDPFLPLSERVAFTWDNDDFLDSFFESIQSSNSDISGTEDIVREIELGKDSPDDTQWVHEFASWIQEMTYLLSKWQGLADDLSGTNYTTQSTKATTTP